MTRAIALARIQIAAIPTLEIARTLVVLACGLALLLAGRALPF